MFAALGYTAVKLLFCGCVLFDRGPETNNTEGLKSALARLRHRTGPTLPNPSTTNSGPGSPHHHSVIVDPKTFHLRDDRKKSCSPTPTPPTTPRKVKVSVTKHHGMTVSVNHAQVSIATSSATSTAVVAIAMARPPSPGNSSGSEVDGVVSSTALRRLYFKSARNAKARGPSVPKVVVMGSSTTSTSVETTINTSTESASTLVTNVTATDTSEACDSLDLADTSGQSEPLLSGSFDEPPTSVSINSQQSYVQPFANNNANVGRPNGGAKNINNNNNTSNHPQRVRHSSNSSSSGGGSSSSQSSEPRSGGGGVGVRGVGAGSEVGDPYQVVGGGDALDVRNPIIPGTNAALLINYSETNGTAHPPAAARTAPASSDTHFPFDVQPIPSPKSVRNREKIQQLFTFCESPTKPNARRTSSATTTTILATVHQPPRSRRDPSTTSNRSTSHAPSGREAETKFSATPPSHQSKYLSKENLSIHRKTYDAHDKHREDYDSIRQAAKPSESTNNSPSQPSISKFGNKNRFINSILSISNMKERYGSKSKINSAPVVVGTAASAPKENAKSAKCSNTSDKNTATTKVDTTMFPFDREAIDYERIQRECFAVEDDEDDYDYNKYNVYPLNYEDDYEPYEASLDSPDQYERAFFDSPAKGDGGQYDESLGRLEKFEYELCEKRSYSKTGHPNQQRSHSVFYPHPHATLENLTNVDAFSPKPKDQFNRQSRASMVEQLSTVSKFEQIASKFNQIPPKSLDAFTTHPNNNPTANTKHGVTTDQPLPQQNHPQSEQYHAPYASHHPGYNYRSHHHQNSTSSSSSPSSSGVSRETPPPLLPSNLRASNSTIGGGSGGGGTDGSSDSNIRQKLDDVTDAPSGGIIGSLADCHQQPAAGSGASPSIVDQKHRDAVSASASAAIGSGVGSGGVGCGAINVTPNPMDTPVCAQPRATIVVQQASLSLDNTVETVLLQNADDFVSVERDATTRKQRQREENMRQLLDVTNTYTTEELRDFEMRYGSPHHCRSQSVKTPGSRASGRPNQLCLPQQRSRVASMPNTGVEEEYYRLRHFSITGKGVVNRGDSLKSKRSRSNNSVASSHSSTEHLTAPQVVPSARTSATCSLASSRESSTSNAGHGPYKVLMLGATSVGKSSLVSQFMTSEYLHAYDTSIDDESGEKSVSVLLSGEESELVFIDHPFVEISPENCLSSYDPHGYCVIYSSADRASFTIAERVIQSLWTSDNIAQRAVILVGNKADLARSRVITLEEGKAMATAYDCKFIETSVGINHNVDELLVGLLSQIRLKLENPEKSRDLFRKRSCRKSKRRACSPLGSACLTGNGGTNPATPVSATGPGGNNLSQSELNTPPSSVQSSPRKYRGSRTSASLKVKGLLGRVWARDSKSKSCENLHVL